MNKPFEEKNAEYFRTKTDYLKVPPAKTDDGYRPPLIMKNECADISPTLENVNTDFETDMHDQHVMETGVPEDDLERGEEQPKQETLHEYENIRGPVFLVEATSA